MAEEQDVVGNGVKLLGEMVVTPGTGLLLEGRMGAGLLHVGLAVAAAAVFGPVGAGIARMALAVNSYSASTGNRNLLDIGGAMAGRGAESETARRASR